MTCKEMLSKSLKIAENLVNIGIGQGDFVTIITEHHNDLVPLVLGIMACGATSNALHTGFTPRKFIC